VPWLHKAFFSLQEAFRLAGELSACRHWFCLWVFEEIGEVFFALRFNFFPSTVIMYARQVLFNLPGINIFLMTLPAVHDNLIPQSPET